MIPSAIQREILIEAPVQTVWGVLTEPAHLASLVDYVTGRS
jgi:uncharacterized protein YndB with AHSA1/START domain